MGYMCDHSMVIRGFKLEAVEEAHRKALEIFTSTPVTPVSYTQYNFHATFAVLPDGSKEGWEPSDRADRERRAFVDWLVNNRRLYLMWYVVAYPEDGPPVVEDSSHARHYEEERREAMGLDEEE